MDRPIKAGAGNSLGARVQLHSKHYRVPQFLEVIQNAQNITALGALGTPHLAIFSGVDPPLPKGEATYNQWTFEVHSIESCYQEGVLWEGIIWSLKGHAANMVQFLGPTPSVDAILDKLDSLYGLVYTFDIMMQGFYRES